MHSNFACDLPIRTWKNGTMSEHYVALGHGFGSGDSNRADPIVANLQQSANLAHENYDQAVALAQMLSAQLREAQDRINQLEREAEGLGDQFLAEAKAIIREVRSNADARVSRAVREADERVDRLKIEAQNQIGRLKNELAQATRGMDQLNDESNMRIESIKKDADGRVQTVETEAKKRINVIERENEEKVLRLTGEAKMCIESIKKEADARVETVEAEAKQRVDVMQRENEDKVSRLEADLTEARGCADRAEQCLMVIRREIEEHLMPAMRDGPKATNSAARPRSLTLPMSSRSGVSTWCRRLWLRMTSTATLGSPIEPANAFDRASPHEPGFCSGAKTVNAATARESSAPSGGSSAELSSVTAG
jgi:hypothetical protein